MRLALFVIAFAASIGFVNDCSRAATPQRFELNKGDHVCLIGNALAERMQHFGWLETYVNLRYPSHNLVFRNMGYSGDEINGYRDLHSRMRSMDFGSQDQWLAGSAPIPQPQKLNKDAPVSANRFKLTNTRADVIFVFYGYNESFAGQAGLEKFKIELDHFLKHTLAERYNGRTAPRLVLFSPIAHENLGDRNLPDGAADNQRLELYTRAMAEVAQANGVFFVDLFTPSRQYFADMSHPRSTINGIHLNEAGDHVVAGFAYEGLFGEPPSFDAAKADKLRAVVNDKNWYWFNRYRTTDGYSTYGDRAFLRFVGGQTNYEVVQRELEVIDLLTSNRDKVVWAAAEGRDIKPDDSNLPPFIPVISNLPGPLPGGKHIFLSGEDEIKTLTVHHGMRVNLFASEEKFPELVNPVQMAFDTRGRLWVAAWQTYPHWKPTEPADDKLLILEDTDGDGSADKCTTFAGDLRNPTGFEFWGGGVIVAQGPDILFLKDTNGDDKYDVKQRIIHGMDTADTHHTSNSFVLDPGGALYFQEGTFHHTQVETPWGPPRRNANAGVYRYEPRTHKFDVYVTFPFANPHGHAFDRWGQDIVVDGTGAVPYHAPLFSSRLEFPQKHNGTPQVYKQRTRPCPGIEFLSSRHFPDEMQGNLLVANVIGFQGILRYKVFDKGSSLGATEMEPILYSSDRNFRPADLEIGPDGAIYFTDWHNPIIGHMQHNLRDPNRDRIHGRVYRVTYEGRPLETPPRIAGEPINKLLELLKASDDRLRARVRIELSGRETSDVIAAARNWIQKVSRDSGDPNREHHLLEALWLFQSHNVVDGDLLGRVLHSPADKARAAAVRVCAYWQDRLPNVLDLLGSAAEDKSPLVRLMAVWAASYVPRPEAVETVLRAQDQPDDEYSDYLAKEVMRTLGPQFERARAEGRPIAFKTQAGARYLLKNLSNAQLLARTGDRLVYLELLSRSGLTDEQRRGTIQALARLEGTDESHVIRQAILSSDSSAHSVDISVAFDLLRQLNGLAAQRSILHELALTARRDVLRQLAFASIVNADGNAEEAWKLSLESPQAIRDLESFVACVPFISDASVRAGLYDRIAPLLDGLPQSIGGTRAPREAPSPSDTQAAAAFAIRRAAMRALTRIRGREADTFRKLAQFVRAGIDRPAAIHALQAIPRSAWLKEDAGPLTSVLIEQIRKTPVRRRTQAAALDAREFCDALSTLLPPAEARSVRAQLRELGVRVVKLGTLFERMSYDKDVVAVQAGKPVEFVLENNDLMPHNFVIVAPGSLEEIGLFSEAHAQQPDFAAHSYVPRTPKVLASSNLLRPRETERLSLIAPTVQGVYPFVCTYPGHWRRMYGALYVVDDLDGYLADPEKYVAAARLTPRDALLKDRRPRTEWTYADLVGPIEEMSHAGGRNFGSGKQIFSVANCIACHRLQGVGNIFGPDLTKLDPKWKPTDILNEILTPSARINEKFQTNVFELGSGKVINGLVLEETPETIKIIENPLASTTPTVIRRGDVVDRQRSTTSMMPKGLLDKLTRDEILDLIAYVAAGGKQTGPAFQAMPHDHHSHSAAN